MQDWVNWLVALCQTCVQWLSSMTVLGAPVLGIIVGVFVIGLIIRSVMYRSRL